MQRSAVFCVFLQKNEQSRCSFTFFAKERCIFCVFLRSSEKNAKERIVLLDLISCQKLKKRT